MQGESMKTATIASERGHSLKLTQLLPYLQRRDWAATVLVTQRRVPRSAFSPEGAKAAPVAYLRGFQEGFLVMNSLGKVFFHVPSAASTTPFTKRLESAVKVLIVQSTAYLVLRRPPALALHFYRVDLSTLIQGTYKRQKILKAANLQVTDLVQVDSKYGKIVTCSHSLFQVWDLDSESPVLSRHLAPGESSWYSRNHVIICKHEEAKNLFVVVDLQSEQHTRITVNGKFQVHHLAVVQKQLVIVAVNRPIAVVELGRLKSYLIGDSPVKYYIETEKLDDEFLVLQNGTGKFVGRPSAEVTIDCKNPLFTDMQDTLVIYDKKGLQVISREGRIVGEISKQLPCAVSALGINEDTMEIYLGLKNGGVAIFH